MPNERTYGEEEVGQIFEAAAAKHAPGSSAPVPAKGLTLAELQAIGGEVGLAPERVAEAAAALDLHRDVRRRTELGMPVGVGRSIDLPRAPTDREWEMIVADLRATFGARGRLSGHGDAREWSNGNLHAYVEPTPTGYRLRLATTKGNALALNRMGGMAFVVAFISLIALSLSGEIAESLFLPVMFMFMGSGAIGLNALRQPGWAAEREAQMEGVAARAQALLAGGGAQQLPPSGGAPLMGTT